jgi:hypothetical protein
MSLSRPDAGGRLSGEAAVTLIARYLIPADQTGSGQQELRHCLARPLCQRQGPVDAGYLGQVRQYRGNHAGVPRLGIKAGCAQHQFSIDLFRDRLLDARRYPTA